MTETVPVFGNLFLTQVNTGDIYYETLLHNSLSISSSINHTIRISPVLHIILQLNISADADNIPES